METIKATSKMEFDVIYADGTRRRAVITPGTINLVKRAAVIMPHLFEGTGFNPLNADVANIVAITRPDHDILHQAGNARQQAIFRLGQMDMQQSVVDMLLADADSVSGVVHATLLDAANHVLEMVVAR